mmetsp:Transcript_20088/g.49284  ORF Transcript_20088/g.49284 Transcript_20088/m.49284 type:complete len:243 (-) Transcript_20088:337-1065(-)
MGLGRPAVGAQPARARPAALGENARNFRDALPKVAGSLHFKSLALRGSHGLLPSCQAGIGLGQRRVLAHGGHDSLHGVLDAVALVANGVEGQVGALVGEVLSGDGTALCGCLARDKGDLSGASAHLQSADGFRGWRLEHVVDCDPRKDALVLAVENADPIVLVEAESRAAKGAAHLGKNAGRGFRASGAEPCGRAKEDWGGGVVVFGDDLARSRQELFNGGGCLSGVILVFRETRLDGEKVL